MLRKLVLAAVATVLALLAAEAALRLTGAAAGGRGAPWYAGGNHPRFLFEADADPGSETGYRLRPGFEGEDAGTGEPPARPQGWRPCLAALEALGRRAQAAGAGLLIVLAESPDDPARAAAERAAAALRAAGLPHLLLDDLLDAADPDLRYPLDRHWSRAGHERVAAALAPEVRRRLGAPTASPPPSPAGARRAPPAPGGGT